MCQCVLLYQETGCRGYIVNVSYCTRKQDAEAIYRDAGNLNLTTGSEFVWLVTEEAMKANNVPVGK